MLAHMLAVIDAFGTDRIEDEQIDGSPGVFAVLGQARRERIAPWRACTAAVRRRERLPRGRRPDAARDPPRARDAPLRTAGRHARLRDGVARQAVRRNPGERRARAGRRLDRRRCRAVRATLETCGSASSSPTTSWTGRTTCSVAALGPSA